MNPADDLNLSLTMTFSNWQEMAPDVRDEKADEMMLLNATLVALHASGGNSSGVDQSVSYLQSVGIARAEAEEVGAINFKALQEGMYCRALTLLNLCVYLSI
jgi:hypothetical protein